MASSYFRPLMAGGGAGLGVGGGWLAGWLAAAPFVASGVVYLLRLAFCFLGGGVGRGGMCFGWVADFFGGSLSTPENMCKIYTTFLNILHVSLLTCGYIPVLFVNSYRNT